MIHEHRLGGGRPPVDTDESFHLRALREHRRIEGGNLITFAEGFEFRFVVHQSFLRVAVFLHFLDAADFQIVDEGG